MQSEAWKGSSPHAQQASTVVLENKHLAKVEAQVVSRVVRVVELAIEQGIDAAGIRGAIPVATVIGVPLLAPERCPVRVQEKLVLDDVLDAQVPEPLHKEVSKSTLYW